MIKVIVICVLAVAAAAASSAAAPSVPAPETGVFLSLSVLSADEAQVNVRTYGHSRSTLDPRRFAFQLRSTKTGIAYFVGASSMEPVNVVAPDPAWRAIVLRFTLRIPKVDEGVYDLSVDPGVRSSNVESSPLALSEPLYIRDATVIPVRAGTKFFHSPDPQHPDLAIETVFNGQLAANVLPTGAPEIDDPIADALSDQYPNKPLWTFGRLEYTCFGGANMGMQVNSDNRQPMYIDHIMRASNVLTGYTMGDPLGFIRTGEASWHGFTYHPLIALLKPFVSEPSWMRYAAPSASPHPGTCTDGIYGLVDDWDIQRTFTVEDPRVTHPEWDPALRTLMLDFKVRVGMTHEMVAFAMGYPSMTGTTAQLAQLPEWSWRPYSSCGADAQFEGDRVVKFSGSTECGSTIDIY